MTDVTKLAKAIFDLIERHQNNHEPLLRSHVEDVVRANAMQILHPMVTVDAGVVQSPPRDDSIFNIMSAESKRLLAQKVIEDYNARWHKEWCDHFGAPEDHPVRSKVV